MGTRHLIAVHKDGEYKIAKYGQWDGYPDGQGAAVLEFISSEENREKLLNSLSKIKAPSDEFMKSYNANAPEWSSDPDNRTAEQRVWWETFAHRGVGASILENVSKSELDEIYMLNNISFAADSLFCEFAYVIDFDAGTFEVFKGFNRSPLSEVDRFHSLKSDGEYYPVKLLHKFNLEELPSESEFLESCSDEEDEAA